MVVGVRVWDLQFIGRLSEGDRRAVMASLVDRVGALFNVSVGQAEHPKELHHLELKVAVVAQDREQAESVLSSADELVEGESRLAVIWANNRIY